MTPSHGKVLPFRRPAAAPPVDPPEYTAALDLVARHGAFVALLVIRFALVILLPAACAHIADPRARRRLQRRLEAAERRVTGAVRMLVQRSER